MSYDSSNLTTPDIKWLGVRPSDLNRFNIPQQCRLPMTDDDVKMGKKMVSPTEFKHNILSKGMAEICTWQPQNSVQVAHGTQQTHNTLFIVRILLHTGAKTAHDRLANKLELWHTDTQVLHSFYFSLPGICTNSIHPFLLRTSTTLSCLVQMEEDFIKANPEWVKELEIMVQTKVKAEIQALSSFGFQYLSQVYLPLKLQEGDWI